MFFDPKWLLLLWSLPLLAVALYFEMKRIRHRLQSFSAYRSDELMSKLWSPKLTFLKSGLLLLVFVCLCFSLARPRWGYEWKDVPQGGRDIIIALDLSTSMQATDISPSRIERAKREIIDLVNMLEGDRIGIVAFAGVAFMHSPLTVDYRMVNLFIQNLSTNLIPVPGTAIGEAIDLSIETLEKASQIKSQGKAIILITDGEDQGSEPLKAAMKAKEKGIKIFTIGIGGKEGAPIPMPDGGFKKDEKDQVILTRIDEKSLQDIAMASDGMYVRASSGDFDLQTIYHKGIKGSVEKGEEQTSRQKLWYERFQLFLALALSALCLEFIIQEFRRKKSTITPVNISKTSNLLGLFLFAGFTAFLSPKIYATQVEKEASQAFDKKDYNKAAQTFKEAENQDPKNLIHSYNQGVSQFFNEDYDGATQSFAKAAQSPDTKLAAQSFYNLGNSLVAKGELKGALAAYEQALQREPNDRATKENRDWVQKQIAEKEKNKDQDNKGEDKKDEDKKDEDKKDEDKKDEDKKDEDKKDQDKKDQDKKDQDKKDQDKKDQDKKESEARDKKEEEKSKDQQEQQSKSETGKPDPAQKSGQKQPQPAKAQDMDKETAERLLRSLEDQEQVFGLPPDVKKQPRHPQAKDW